METRELELKRLVLEIKRNGKAASFPVLRADLLYRVGTFPTVQVTISSAPLFIKTKDKVTDISGLLKDSPEGSLGTLKLTVAGKAGEDIDVILFSGYLAGSSSNLLTSIYTVQSSITFQLICQAAAVNANPGGAYTHFSVLGGEAKNNPRSYIQQVTGNLINLGKESGNSEKPVQTILAEIFRTNPAESTIRLIDELKKIKRNGDQQVAVADGFLTDGIEFKLKTRDNVVDVIQRFGLLLTNALVGAPATSVAVSVLSTLFLSIVPQTIGSDDGKACLLIVRPSVSGWRVKPKIQLSAGDVLGITDTTAYRLDQRVDFWYVQIGNDEVSKASPLAAVYAPGMGEKGKGKLLSLDEFTAEIDKTGKANTALIGRATVLPWWMFAAVECKKPGIAAKLPESGNTPVDGGGTNVGAERDVEESDRNWQRACEQLAIQSFLDNGCAVNSVSLRLPLYTLFRLLPWLGDTISFSIPSPQQTTGERDLYEIPTAARYGLLDGLSMSFECSHKEIQVTCGATLSQVHDKAMHETMAADNVLYNEPADKCYNPAAQEFVKGII